MRHKKWVIEPVDMVERNMEDVLFGHDELEKAAKARAAFKDGQYSEAIQILKELQAKKPNDFRIKHNLALWCMGLKLLIDWKYKNHNFVFEP